MRLGQETEADLCEHTCACVCVRNRTAPKPPQSVCTLTCIRCAPCVWNLGHAYDLKTRVCGCARVQPDRTRATTTKCVRLNAHQMRPSAWNLGHANDPKTQARSEHLRVHLAELECLRTCVWNLGRSTDLETYTRFGSPEHAPRSGPPHSACVCVCVCVCA